MEVASLDSVPYLNYSVEKKMISKHIKPVFALNVGGVIFSTIIVVSGVVASTMSLPTNRAVPINKLKTNGAHFLNDLTEEDRDTVIKLIVGADSLIVDFVELFNSFGRISILCGSFLFIFSLVNIAVLVRIRDKLNQVE